MTLIPSGRAMCIVLLPVLPGSGKSHEHLGSGLQRWVTLHNGLSLGHGEHVVFHFGSHCTWVVLAAASHTQPHTLRSVFTWAWRACGGRGGQRSLELAAATDPSVFCWSFGLANPSGYWLLFHTAIESR